MTSKEQKYDRIYAQLEELTRKIDNPLSRMSTICAVLHHKFDLFFWTGFYLLTDKGELEVACYQGPLACLRLKKDTGVCWTGVNTKQTVIVDDVHCFEGHIACNPLSKSEIVIPLFNGNSVSGVLDIDSDKLKAFDKTDAIQLIKIVDLVYKKY
jgi:L-methionine (R)-S-oxide reductase